MKLTPEFRRDSIPVVVIVAAGVLRVNHGLALQHAPVLRGLPLSSRYDSEKKKKYFKNVKNHYTLGSRYRAGPITNFILGVLGIGLYSLSGH